MKKNEGVIFRRVKGRIVPIKVQKNPPAPKITDKRKAEIRQGAGFIAAGLAASLAGGEVAARLVRKSASMRFAAKGKFSHALRGLMSVHSAQAASEAAQGVFDFAKVGAKQKDTYTKIMRAAAAARQKSSFLFKGRNIALGVGGTLGAALISTGLSRLNTGQETVKEDIAQNVAATAVAGAGAAFYYARLGGGLNLAQIYRFAKTRVQGAPRPGNVAVKFKKPSGKYGKMGFE